MASSSCWVWNRRTPSSKRWLLWALEAPASYFDVEEANRRIAYAFQNPILDPSGTRDPFNYNIEKFYGASDHQVHLDWEPRIAAVQFGNWPDAVYHSSDDSPANQDPTQMKRAAFLMIAVGSVFANAGPADAVAIAGVSVSYAQKRMASDLADALNLIAASTTATFNDNYKEALNVIRQAYLREWNGFRTARSLTMGVAIWS